MRGKVEIENPSVSRSLEEQWIKNGDAIFSTRETVQELGLGVGDREKRMSLIWGIQDIRCL